MPKKKLDPRTSLEYYTKEAIRSADYWTDSLIRTEYSRLRDIAEKRLKRLAEAEPESYAYRTNIGQYAPARGQSTEALREQLPALAKFIAAKTGTVRGIRMQRSRAVATLRGQGYDFINARNIRAFGEFMDEWRAQELDHSIGSPTAAESFEFMQEHDIQIEQVKDDFAQWIKHRKKLEKYVSREEKKTGKPVTADMILKEFSRQRAAEKKRNVRRRKK